MNKIIKGGFHLNLRWVRKEEEGFSLCLAVGLPSLPSDMGRVVPVQSLSPCSDLLACLRAPSFFGSILVLQSLDWEVLVLVWEVLAAVVAETQVEKFLH